MLLNSSHGVPTLDLVSQSLTWFKPSTCPASAWVVQRLHCFFVSWNDIRAFLVLFCTTTTTSVQQYLCRLDAIAKAVAFEVALSVVG